MPGHGRSFSRYRYGGDAYLVVQGPLSCYGHLAAFVRDAPAPQQHALWMTFGRAMELRAGDRPVWLSTAGGGVAWLHVRPDDHPKAYGYVPYRSPPPAQPMLSGCT